MGNILLSLCLHSSINGQYHSVPSACKEPRHLGIRSHSQIVAMGDFNPVPVLRSINSAPSPCNNYPQFLQFSTSEKSKAINSRGKLHLVPLRIYPALLIQHLDFPLRKQLSSTLTPKGLRISDPHCHFPGVGLYLRTA